MPSVRAQPDRRWHVAGAIVVLALTAAGPASAGAGPDASAHAAAGFRLGQRPLAPGASGRDVRELQRTLNRLDLRAPVTGSFDARTAQLVRRYEHRRHLPVDGVVSRGQARGMRGRAGTPAFGGRTLRRGDRGRDVRRLQAVLTGLGIRISPDGVFGTRTERMVRRFERRERLLIDGVVSRAQARDMDRRLAAGQAPAATPATPVAGGPARFPVAGPHTFAGVGGRFGDRSGGHKGQDIFAACGTPLVAVEAGSVAVVGREPRAGNYVVLHGALSGMDAVYMHLRDRSPLPVGTPTAAGMPIGVAGQTGNATACHLHFELWTAPGWYRGGRAINPMPGLRAWPGA